MKWTWLVLFLITVGGGVFFLRSCPKQAETPNATPTPSANLTQPLAPPPPTQLPQGNGPLSAPDSGLPKAPDPNNNYPVYPGVSPVPHPNTSPIPNYEPPVYTPPPNTYQPPTYSEPGFDPNAGGVPPPPPPPPPPGFDGDYDGTNVPPPVFEPPEDMGEVPTQPYNPED